MRLKGQYRLNDEDLRAQKHQQVQLCMLIDKCTQILRDDRIFLRNKVKAKDLFTVSLLKKHKKHSNLHKLQVELRKFITDFKSRAKAAQLAAIKQNLIKGLNEANNLRKERPKSRSKSKVKVMEEGQRFDRAKSTHQLKRLPKEQSKDWTNRPETSHLNPPKNDLSDYYSMMHEKERAVQNTMQRVLSFSSNQIEQAVRVQSKLSQDFMFECSKDPITFKQRNELTLFSNDYQERPQESSQEELNLKRLQNSPNSSQIEEMVRQMNCMVVESKYPSNYKSDVVSPLKEFLPASFQLGRGMKGEWRGQADKQRQFLSQFYIKKDPLILNPLQTKPVFDSKPVQTFQMIKPQIPPYPFNASHPSFQPTPPIHLEFANPPTTLISFAQFPTFSHFIQNKQPTPQKVQVKPMPLPLIQLRSVRPSSQMLWSQSSWKQHQMPRFQMQTRKNEDERSQVSIPFTMSKDFSVSNNSQQEKYIFKDSSFKHNQENYLAKAKFLGNLRIFQGQPQSHVKASIFKGRRELSRVQFINELKSFISLKNRVLQEERMQYLFTVLDENQDQHVTVQDFEQAWLLMG